MILVRISKILPDQEEVRLDRSEQSFLISHNILAQDILTHVTVLEPVLRLVMLAVTPAVEPALTERSLNSAWSTLTSQSW